MRPVLAPQKPLVAINFDKHFKFDQISLKNTLSSQGTRRGLGGAQFSQLGGVSKKRQNLLRFTKKIWIEAKHFDLNRRLQLAARALSVIALAFAGYQPTKIISL